ncbi:histone deacetylase 8-like [Ylistrum balloti]|uniref:histone deacetylase 8-like n=1 Tax=Ylistrum balloti TaxID=509963 RepID=UPI002905900A|nr:histone deacetylase 8-like [Ylistrum balloti]
MDIEQPAKRLRVDPHNCLDSCGLLGVETEESVKCTLPGDVNVASDYLANGNMSVLNVTAITASCTSSTEQKNSESQVSNHNDTEHYHMITDERKTKDCIITQANVFKDNGTDFGSSSVVDGRVSSSYITEQKTVHQGDNVTAEPVTVEHHDICKSVYDLEEEEDSSVQIPSLQSLRMSKQDNKENITIDTKEFSSAPLNSEKLKVDDIGDKSSNILEKGEVEQTDVCGSSESINVDLSKHASKKTAKLQRRVSYIYSKELIQQCNLMQKIPNRAIMVHSLIEAYGILKYMRVIAPSIATEESLCLFHSPEYIEFLKKISDEDDEEIYGAEAAEFGLTYDCPVHKGVFDYALSVGGATVSAAEELVQGRCDIAINWCGGWHHAQKDSASGFCYVNDIVLGILKLREKFSRVLYVDLDLHHGDGVQNAFYATSAVMTVSIHKYASGFFPGSGQLEEIGVGKGKKYCINIPLHDGARDQEFVALFCRVIQKVRSMFKPEAVVCQCGADGLAGDPMDSFNLTPRSLGRCVYFILDWSLPTLLLGGGGYHHTNTARCWTFLTGVAVGKKLPTDIPDHQFFVEYGPDYGIEVSPGNRKDQNSQEYLRKVHRSIMDILSQ